MSGSSPVPFPEPVEWDTLVLILFAPCELIHYGLLVCIREVQDLQLRCCVDCWNILAISNILKFFAFTSSAFLPIPCLTVVLVFILFSVLCCVRPNTLHSLHKMPPAQVVWNAVAVEESRGSKIGSIKPEKVIYWIILLKLCFPDEILTSIFKMSRS